MGAGVLGKSYCRFLRESGCSVIDVGSLLDVWSGKISDKRQGLKRNPRMNIEHLKGNK